ncbi:MAG: metallophosphoesterase [Candidatus Thorarchaeota archaeon]
MDLLVLTDIHNNWAHLEELVSLADELDGVVFLGDLRIHGSSGITDSVLIRKFSRIHEASKFTIGVPGNSVTPELIQYMDDNEFNVHGKSRIINDIGFFGVGGVADPVNLILELRAFFKEKIRSAIKIRDDALETLAVFGVTIRDDIFVVEDWSEKQIKELERFRGPFDHTEEEIQDILFQGFQTLSDCSVRILLSHIPPYEPLLNPKFPEGVSTGSKGITQFIKEYRPSAVLSGHYHISHEFEIANVPCFTFPAVIDGFYSILTIDQHTRDFKVKAKIF